VTPSCGGLLPTPTFAALVPIVLKPSSVPLTSAKSPVVNNKNMTPEECCAFIQAACV